MIREDLGDDRLIRAIEWWQAQRPRPDSPFVAENPLMDNVAYRRAEAIAKNANAEFAAAVRAGDTGDRYTLATVLFAVVLFSSGIAGQFRRRPIRMATLALAGGSLALGAAYVGLTLLGA